MAFEEQLNLLLVAFDLVGFVCLYLCVELLYFNIATRYDIVDKPNSRSSHTSIVVRGGGVIFVLAYILPLAFSRFEDWQFLTVALLIVAIVSFVDDKWQLDSRIRLIAQSIAVLIIVVVFCSDISLLFKLIVFVLLIGSINAYNFMDGINGITALYSAVSICSLWWVNSHLIQLIPNIYFLSLFASLIVFSFFNVRKVAACFAGDVGSVTIAFIISFLNVLLCIRTNSVVWVLILSVYGIETLVTILCRLVRKENLLQAHRSHFYQFLVNEKKIGHPKVAALYSTVQAFFNVILVYAYKTNTYSGITISLLALLFIYIIFRLRFEGYKRLFISYQPRNQ